MAKTIIRLEDGYHTTVMARGHVWHSDAPLDQAGHDLAPTPEESLMGALGSCMAMTAKMYAERKGWQLDRVQIALDFRRIKGEDYPAYDGNANVVHEVREQIVLEGPLDDDQKQRILEIMGKCPVRRVLANPVFFVESILEEDAAV